MSTEEVQETTSQTQAVADWEPTMPPTDLIFDDGEPLESNRHRIAMNALIRSVNQAFAERNDFLLAAICLFTTAANRRKTGIFVDPISLLF